MARPRKKRRTQVAGKHGAANAAQASGKKPPKSMVIRMGAGDVGSSISQLTKDFRVMMEPDTASRLRERKSNKLKDYTAMAGPLGVTHLFLFSRSKAGNNNLRIALAPRGPTLHFQIEKYSLCKDVIQAQRHAKGGLKEFQSPPLLVMNNFASPDEETNSDPVKKQLESLTTTIFQSIFPPISPQATPLSSINRIMLLNREKDKSGTYVLSLRHYAITTRRTGVSKKVRRFDAAEQRTKKRGHELPNMGKLADAADYILDAAALGYTSVSETELDTDAEVEVLETSTRKVLNRKEMQKLREGELKGKDLGGRSHVEKRAVKLVELGPRMRLRMVKVEEGLCEGRVMWNEFVKKTAEEVTELDEKWEQRHKEKDERRKQQRENVERKKQLKANTRANAGEDGPAEDDDEMIDADAEYDSFDLEEAESDDENEYDDDDEELMDG